MQKIKLATIWLDGCSGCHMSFLDMDERLLALSEQVELVYSPLVDVKHFPTGVDVTLVEGAISTDEDLKKIKTIRQRSKLVIAFGDCAITANIPSLRNPEGAEKMLGSIYVDMPVVNPQVPRENLPVLLDRAKPLHHTVKVDHYLPGCPPSADAIYHFLTDLLAGGESDVSCYTRFGA
ncbi:MAG: NADP oxidoreductase [Anaerolineae bacterium]|nr:NADP oxidoreductase [Anaerolineae bacterium]